RRPHAVGSRSMTTSSERPAGSVDPKLLEILVCPLTKGPLEYDAEKQELISRSAKLAYPIRAGIPIMLPEEARRLDCPSFNIGCYAAGRIIPPRRTFPLDSCNENLPEKRIHQSCGKQPGRDALPGFFYCPDATTMRAGRTQPLGAGVDCRRGFIVFGGLRG